MKLVLLGLLLLVVKPLSAQTVMLAQTSWKEGYSYSSEETPIEQANQFSGFAEKFEASDSLIARRRFLTTVFYRNGKRLRNTTVIRSFLSNRKSVNQFQWGHVLNPIGPLVSLSGLAIGHLAVQGTTHKAPISGIRTPATPYPDDIEVEYKKRNLPLLLAGLGIFVGGICLIEISNDLMRKPADTYNATLKKQPKTAFLSRVRLEITPNGNLGLLARF